MICTKCGRENPLSQGEQYCAFCGSPLELSQNSSEEPSHKKIFLGDAAKSSEETRSQSGNFYSCPWEKLDEMGFFQGLLLTLKQSLFEPTHFFRRLPRNGGWLNPILYGILIGTLGNLGGYLLGTLMEIPWVSQGKWSQGFTLFFGLLMPFLVLVGIMLWTILLHGSLFLFGARKEPFEATLRIVSYASGPEIFNVLPGVGWLVAMIWKMIMTIIGVREIQGVSTGRALAAVLFPVIVLWGVFFAGILAIIAFGAFLLGSM